MNSSFRRSLFLVLALLVQGFAIAQKAYFNHPLTVSPSGPAPASVRHVAGGADTLHVLAVMVSFQFEAKDDDRTTGKGVFDLSTPSKPYVDAPPHNRAYFADHLTFVKNYFRKSSNERLVIVDSLLDSVYQLPNKMAAYAPPHNSTNNAEIGKLMIDTWSMVDRLTPGIPYKEYHAFVIFHAGAGHDIDFASIYGYDPTPFDLPSIYLGAPSLQKIYGPTFPGIVLNHPDGSFDTIRNSMILPETENRPISGGGSTSLLKLGMNGLFAASIGSYLGLPDLFNTKDGSSGIGRFGLMDGQSIFSWGGVFPPEPSAWEKQYLHWVDPIVVNSGAATYSLPAVGLTTANDSIYKVLIDRNEYFLVENRNRDAHRDGAIVTMSTPGGIIQRSWARDVRVGFNAFDQDSLIGNVIDVDEFDWSLPGGVNTSTNEFFDGGILIWHIDENVITSALATNAVNANSSRKGVNLMEADGSQDIGQLYGILDPGYNSETGTALDFWYDGNPAPLRAGAKNAFTPTSYPGSKSNDDANSHIFIRQFSPRGPQMTANIQVGDSLVQPIAGFPRKTDGITRNSAIKVAPYSGGTAIVAGTSGSVYGWNANGSPLLSGLDTTGLLEQFTPGHIDGPVGIADLNHDNNPEVVSLQHSGGGPASLSAISLSNAKDPRFPDSLYTIPIPSAGISGPSISDSAIAWPGAATVYTTPFNGAAIDSFTNIITGADTIVGLTLVDSNNKGSYASLSANGFLQLLFPTIFQRSPARYPGRMVAPAIYGSVSQTAGSFFIFSSSDGVVYTAGMPKGETLPWTSLPGFPFATHGEVANAPTLADIDGDGSRDIIVFSGNKIWALNASGAVLANFPIIVPSDKTILTSPIVADIDQNGTPDIIAVTQEGTIVAYDKNGKLANGFPIQSGKNNGATPAVFPLTNPDGIGLAVASADSLVYAYRAGTSSGPLAAQPWPQYLHDAKNTGFIGPASGPIVGKNDFLPAEFAYNWPNPVGPAQQYKTFIRYYLGQDADVTVKVYDMAGDLVVQFPSRRGAGGMDNEFEWNVQGVQSGVYFAHIEAQGSSRHGTAIIKIAVIK